MKMFKPHFIYEWGFAGSLRGIADSRHDPLGLAV